MGAGAGRVQELAAQLEASEKDRAELRVQMEASEKDKAELRAQMEAEAAGTSEGPRGGEGAAGAG